MSRDSSAAPFDAKAFLRTLTHKPGVYRMLDAAQTILYVGKARDLRKRVGSYFRKRGLEPKTQALMAQTRAIEVTVTHTESEALILENDLIKRFRPRYNVLLRDDKSYPYLYLSTDQTFPRLTLHRGARKGKGRYFGPYPGAQAVHESLNLLQKVFRLRQCEDNFFRNRSRPCLQYQIKRCSGPCVGKVDAETYARDVRDTELFLQGRNTELIDQLAGRMEQASLQQDYERAALLRDQVTSLRRVQERQYVSGDTGELDIVAVVGEADSICVQLFVVRGGSHVGNQSFFPKAAPDTTVEEALSAFLAQYYLGRDPPPTVLISHEIEDRDLLQAGLAAQAGHQVSLRRPERGALARWMDLALTNARHAMHARLSSQAGMQRRLEALTEALQLYETPERIECFDISHTAGEATVASCVVFNAEGPVKSDYRRFNISGITPGDDYAAMEQVLTRRYTRVKEGEGRLPDLVLIDGGKGQVSAARAVMEELQLTDVQLIGVAKGATRRPGMEVLWRVDGSSVRLASDSAALHLIQQIRDEAHRFAIIGHRHRRGNSRSRSPLEGIAGVGSARRQQLLRQFGGLREVARAGVEDLQKVKGIGRELAQRIYDTFHSDSG